MLAALAVLACFPAPAAAAPPAAPRDPYAEATRPDQVVLTWRSGSDPAPELERYAVYRDGVRVGETDTPRFVDEWLLESTRYEYVVRALGPDGESAGLARRADHDPAVPGVRDRALSPAADTDRRRRSYGRPTSPPRPCSTLARRAARLRSSSATPS